MPMSNGVAQQVADLINEQNQLAARYTAKSILDNQEQYLIRLEGDTVLGAAQEAAVTSPRVPARAEPAEPITVSATRTILRRGTGITTGDSRRRQTCPP